MKENHIFPVSNRLSDFRTTNNSYSTCGYITIKYIIPINIIGGLLSVIRKQDHKARNLRNPSTY
jgi:hypothetical protein